MQVASRLWLLWGIVDAAPAATLTRYERGLSISGFSLPFGFHTMLMAWGLSEAIRYSFFSVKVRSSSNAIALTWVDVAHCLAIQDSQSNNILLLKFRAGSAALARLGCSGFDRKVGRLLANSMLLHAPAALPAGCNSG